MPKVVIADDEEFVRYFLKSVAGSLAYDVVAEVDNGNDLVLVMRKTCPDILLLDINMPYLTGLEFLKNYAKEFPKTCIIILTSANSFKYVQETLDKGASCFLRKDTPVEQMVSAIEKTWSTFKIKKGINV